MPTWSYAACLAVPVFTHLTNCLHFQKELRRNSDVVIGGSKRPAPRDIPKGRLLAVNLLNILIVSALLCFTKFAHEAGWTTLELRALDTAGAWARFLGEIVLILAIVDTWFYWVHRICHRHRWLYLHGHAVHHRVNQPHVWHNLYQHPIDYLLVTTAPKFLVAFLPLGFGHHAFVTALLISLIFDNVGHTGFEVTAKFKGRTLPPNGWTFLLDPGRRWIAKLVTNTLDHDLHHKYYDRGFGLYFTWWDRLCGTRHPDADHLEKFVEPKSGA